MKDTYEIQLKAYHFKDTEYTDNNYCPIAKALRRQFKALYSSEGVDECSVGEDSDNYKRFKHEPYDAHDYDRDKHEANLKNYNQSTIRTITLELLYTISNGVQSIGRH